MYHCTFRNPRLRAGVAGHVADELEELVAHPCFHVRLEAGEEIVERGDEGSCHVGGAGGGVGEGAGMELVARR